MVNSLFLFRQTFLPRSVRRLSLPILVLVFAGLGVWGARNMVKPWNGTDFLLFRAIGPAARSGLWQNVWQRDKRGDLIIFTREQAYRGYVSEHHANALSKDYGFYPTGTPFFYSLFHMTRTPSFDRDYRRFQNFAVGMLFTGILLLCRLRRVSWPETVFLGVVLGTVFHPVWIDLYFANVNTIQIGFLAALFAARRWMNPWLSSFVSAFLAILLVLFKPTLMFSVLFVIAWWIWNEDEQKLPVLAAGASLAAAIALLIPRAVLGPAGSWTSWWEGFSLTVHHYVGTSIRSRLLMAISENTSQALVMAIVLLTAVAVLVQPMRRRVLARRPWMADYPFRRREEALVMSLGATLYVATAPLVWYHYGVLLIPMMILLYPGRDGLNDTSSEAWMWRAALAVPFFLAQAHPEGPLGLMPSTIALRVAAAILSVMGLMEMARMRRRTSPIR